MNSLSDKSLVEKIRKADDAYHNNDDPIMTDHEYDALRKELISRNIEYNRVGAPLTSTFEKVVHTRPCLSLDNLFVRDDVKGFVSRCVKSGASSLIDEAKIDGLSITLHYENGKFVLGATRGDGREGEDVTANCRMINDIPQSIPFKGSLEVRGEVYMSKLAFLELNRQYQEIGKKLIANPRNGASGAVRQKNAERTKERNLSFFAYDMQSDDYTPELDTDRMKFLSDNGFSVTEYSVIPLTSDIDETVDRVMERFENHNHVRSDRIYDVDGVVYKVNEMSIRQSMGENSRTPLWGIAHKFDAEKVETTLVGIDFQVGRTNVITPVAHVAPVGCGGVIISKLTLHNMDYIRKFNLKIGDRVVIQRAGDVIPQLVSVVVSNHDNQEIEAPHECPACHAPVRYDGVKLVCTNAECSGARFEEMSYFVSRDIMNCNNVGPSVVRSIVDNLHITTPFKIYDLTEDDFVRIGFSDKMAKKYIEGINASRVTTIQRVIASLGIDLVSRGSGKKLSEKYGNINVVLEALRTHDDGIVEVLKNVKGGNLLEWATTENVENLSQFISKHLTVEEISVQSDSIWSGKTVVITGTFSSMDREEIKRKMESLGAKIGSGVSKNTDVVIYGEKAGSKLTKAKELNVRIMDEEEWKGSL